MKSFLNILKKDTHKGVNVFREKPTLSTISKGIKLLKNQKLHKLKHKYNFC